VIKGHVQSWAIFREHSVGARMQQVILYTTTSEVARS